MIAGMSFGISGSLLYSRNKFLIKNFFMLLVQMKKTLLYESIMVTLSCNYEKKYSSDFSIFNINFSNL